MHNELIFVVNWVIVWQKIPIHPLPLRCHASVSTLAKNDIKLFKKKNTKGDCFCFVSIIFLLTGLHTGAWDFGHDCWCEFNQYSAGKSENVLQLQVTGNMIWKNKKVDGEEFREQKLTFSQNLRVSLLLLEYKINCYCTFLHDVHYVNMYSC